MSPTPDDKTITIPTLTSIPTKEPTPTTAQVIAKARVSVVRIQTKTGTGSGVVIDSQGHILTNNHVVEGFTVVGVGLDDGRWLSGNVIAVDKSRDLAIVTVDSTEMRPIMIGKASRLAVGDEVIALGYPLGLEGEVTVTKGMLSARRVDQSVGITFLQTDAAINPGNSGGALINEKGELVGINTLGVRWSGDIPIEGMGFAISVDDASSATKLMLAQSVGNPQASQAMVTPTIVSSRSPTKEPATPNNPPAPPSSPPQSQPPAPAASNSIGGTAVLVVKDRNGNPCQNQPVQLQERDAVRKYDGMLNAQGEATINNVVPGGYTWVKTGCTVVDFADKSFNIKDGQTVVKQLEWDPRPDAVFTIRLQPASGFPLNANRFRFQIEGMWLEDLPIMADGSVRIVQRPGRILKFLSLFGKEGGKFVSFNPPMLGPLAPGVGPDVILRWSP